MLLSIALMTVCLSMEAFAEQVYIRPVCRLQFYFQELIPTPFKDKFAYILLLPSGPHHSKGTIKASSNLQADMSNNIGADTVDKKGGKALQVPQPKKSTKSTAASTAKAPAQPPRTTIQSALEYVVSNPTSNMNSSISSSTSLPNRFRTPRAQPLPMTFRGVDLLPGARGERLLPGLPSNALEKRHRILLENVLGRKARRSCKQPQIRWFLPWKTSTRLYLPGAVRLKWLTG